MGFTDITKLTGQIVVQANIGSPIEFTPSAGGTTTDGSSTYSAASTTGQYTQRGNKGLFNGNITFSTVTSAPTGTLTVKLPAGITRDLILLPKTGARSYKNCGSGRFYDSSAAISIPIIFLPNGADSDEIAIFPASGTPIPTVATGDEIYFNFEIDITEFALTAFVAYNAGLVTGALPGLIKAKTPNTALTVTGTTWTTIRAQGYAYEDNNGVWKLNFNIVGSISGGGARIQQDVAITGVVFKNVTNFRQSVEGTIVGAFVTQPTGAYASPNTNTIVQEHSSLTPTFYSISGDVELNAKPSWA